MEPDVHFSPARGDSSHREAGTSRFLDSLGFGEDEAADGSPVLPAAAAPAPEDEGVVLSASEEAFELPAAAPARGLSVSFSVTRGAAAAPTQPDVESISLPREDEDPSPPTTNPAPDAPASEAPLLHLHCPECDGSLMLRREHLGVEGMCVWCKAPIVAAESGRNGEVKVFRLFGAPQVPPAPPASSEPAKQPEVAPQPEPTAAPSAWSLAPAADFPAPSVPSTEEIRPERAATPSVPETAFPETAPQPSQPAAHASEPPAFPPSATPSPTDSASPWGLPSPASPQAPTTPEETAPDPSDLESLYDSGGFVPPSDSPSPGAPFAFAAPPSAEPLAHPAPSPGPAPSPATDPQPFGAPSPARGFGAFLEGAVAENAVSSPLSAPPAPPAAASPFDGASPWATPADPAPAADPVPQGFAAPAPSTPAPSTPAPSTPAPSGFAAPAEKAASPFPSLGPLEDDLGFSPTPISAFSTGSASDEAPLPLSDSPRPSSPFAPLDLPVEGGDQQPRPFSNPMPDFAAAQPAPAAPEAAPLFAEVPTPLPWGAPPASDDAPKPLGEPQAAEGDTPAPVSSSQAPASFFGDAPAPRANPFGDAPAAAIQSPFASGEGASPNASFGDTAPSPVDPSPVAPPRLPSPEKNAAAALGPTVVSQPLDSGRKPALRKGFVVLMVTILGFASGAALATYLLPVDRYVASIRAYLEERVGTAEPAPSIPLPAAVPVPAPAPEPQP